VVLVLGGACLYGLANKQKKDKKKKEAEFQKAQMDRIESALADSSKTAAAAAAAAASAAAAAATSMTGGGSVGAVDPTGASFSDHTFGGSWRVVTAYEPQMEDEVRLNVGEEVNLETIYNDGWARGTNLVTGVSGYLPMACLQPTGASGSASSNASIRHLSQSRFGSVYAPSAQMMASQPLVTPMGPGTSSYAPSEAYYPPSQLGYTNTVSSSNYGGNDRLSHVDTASSSGDRAPQWLAATGAGKSVLPPGGSGFDSPLGGLTR